MAQRETRELDWKNVQAVPVRPEEGSYWYVRADPNFDAVWWLITDRPHHERFLRRNQGTLRRRVFDTEEEALAAVAAIRLGVREDI